MTIESPFGTVEAEIPFEDAEGRCGCGAIADLDGGICADCFEVYWNADAMGIEIVDEPTARLARLALSRAADEIGFELPVPTVPTNQLAA